MVAEFLGRVFDLEQDAAGAVEKNLPGLREDGFAPEPVEKFPADLGLQVDYLLTQRRLADVRAFRRAGEISGFGDGNDVAKLV
jgi:hypothetical protein